MPVRTTRQIITVPNGEESQLKITLELELNINLNANGLQATVTAKDIKAEEVSEKGDNDDGFGGFVVPTFEPIEEKIEFGKKVGPEEVRTGEWPLSQSVETYLKQKSRQQKDGK